MPRTANAPATGRFPAVMAVEKAARPLRIAVVYSRIPLPMRRADQMTVAHLLGFLKARGHKVDLYCINAGAVSEEADFAWLGKNCSRVHLYPHDVFSIAAGVLKALCGRIPFQVALFSHAKQRRDLKAQIAARSYDVVYTYYFRSAEVSRDLTPSPAKLNERRGPVSFLALQLSQTLNTVRIAENAPNLFLKLFYCIESCLVGRYESRIWQHFTRTVLIGKCDVEEIQRTCRRLGRPLIDNYVYGAHGTDISRFAPRPDVREKPFSLVFSGVMRTPTNINAVVWFAEKVWPLVRAACPQAVWTIVGREPSFEVKNLGALPGVRVTGTVADPAVYISEASICINPMQAGGGMQNKLVEYLACGKPVVATSVANEGVGAAPDEHLLVADEPEAFAEAVIRLLRDEALRRSLGKAARSFAQSHWTWEAHFLKLENDFYQALDGAPPSGITQKPTGTR